MGASPLCGGEGVDGAVELLEALVEPRVEGGLGAGPAGGGPRSLGDIADGFEDMAGVLDCTLVSAGGRGVERGEREGDTGCFSEADELPEDVVVGDLQARWRPHRCREAVQAVAERVELGGGGLPVPGHRRVDERHGLPDLLQRLLLARLVGVQLEGERAESDLAEPPMHHVDRCFLLGDEEDGLTPGEGVRDEVDDGLGLAGSGGPLQHVAGPVCARGYGREL